MKSALYFVEYLTPRTWVFSLLPKLIWDRICKQHCVICCYVIDGSQLSMLLARLSAWIAGTVVKKLDFSLVDLQDDKGALIGLRIIYEDLFEAQQDVMKQPGYQTLIEQYLFRDRLPMFLAKSITSANWTERGTMWRALFLVQISVWKTQRLGNQSTKVFLVMEQCPWIRSIINYANQREVTLVPVPPALNLRVILRHRIPPELIDKLRFLRYRLRQRGLLGSIFDIFSSKSNKHASDQPQGQLTYDLQTSLSASPESHSRVAVEYYGHLNLDHPELHSNLFFWQESSIPGRDILLTFAYPADPLDEPKWAEMQKHGIGAAVLHPGATTLSQMPIFSIRPKRVQTPWKGSSISHNELDLGWLKERISAYQTLRAYWASLFDQHGVKIYICWDKNGGKHCAIADAMQSVGGVTAIYQRSYECDSSPETTVGSDIIFGFSPTAAAIERASNSVVKYHVVTGYIGDHRFPLLRTTAQSVRNKLKQRGAQHILSYTDENSGDDSRWHTGHSFMQRNYAFLLEKLMTSPWLGLVIKPKTPQTLRRRLGPVAELLREAEETGRCHVFEGGVIQGAYPPVAAGLAADIAIHGHLGAGTAGVELALAGIPTLLLDREGWPRSPLYRLGKGQVVFTNWEELWEACTQHWATPGGIPGFGDWSYMLDELDPFRDGQAAKRMGTYIKWLIEGFQAGHDRDRTMADAAEKYCGIWGSDKITSINSGNSSTFVVA